MANVFQMASILITISNWCRKIDIYWSRAYNIKYILLIAYNSILWLQLHLIIFRIDLTCFAKLLKRWLESRLQNYVIGSCNNVDRFASFARAHDPHDESLSLVSLSWYSWRINWRDCTRCTRTTWVSYWAVFSSTDANRRSVVWYEDFSYHHKKWLLL